MKNWIFLLLFLVPFSSSCYRAIHPIDIIQRKVEAHNRHDVTKELSLYTDDVIFIIPGENPIVGKTAFRDLCEMDSVVNCNLIFKDLIVHGDTVFATVIESSDWFRSFGISEFHYQPGEVTIFRKGLIQKVILAPPAEEDKIVFDKSWSDMMGWLNITYPELVKEAQSGWLARYDAKSALGWKKLLNEWNTNRVNKQK